MGLLKAWIAPKRLMLKGSTEEISLNSLFGWNQPFQQVFYMKIIVWIKFFNMVATVYYSQDLILTSKTYLLKNADVLEFILKLMINLVIRLSDIILLLWMLSLTKPKNTACTNKEVIDTVTYKYI